MAGMEYSESDGLLIDYDEETGTVTFTWDEETHPQWNCLLGLTSEKFSQLLKDYLIVTVTAFLIVQIFRVVQMDQILR